MTNPVKIIGVVGAGTMGAGIAQVAAQSGYDVVLIDAQQEFVDRGIERIQSDLDKAVQRDRISATNRDATLARILGTTDYGALGSCQLVIEAVPETFAVKEPVLTAISKSTRADCIIASNTSSLSIMDLSTYVSNPERMIGMHFFNPVSRMELVEVVASNNTDAAVVDIVTDVAKSLGKTPVHSKDKPGFIVNRLLIPMINEAIQALQDEVATPEDIDTAMKLGAAHPMGPLALADLIGLDVVLNIMQVLQRNLGEKYTPAAMLVEHVKAGKLGRKTREGFFTYEEKA